MGICKGCGQQIDWVKTTNGRSMPVDPEYVEIDPTGHHDTVVTDEAFPNFKGTYVCDCPRCVAIRDVIKAAETVVKQIQYGFGTDLEMLEKAVIKTL